MQRSSVFHLLSFARNLVLIRCLFYIVAVQQLRPGLHSGSYVRALQLQGLVPSPLTDRPFRDSQRECLLHVQGLRPYTSYLFQ